jgi:hypothetical protein
MVGERTEERRKNPDGFNNIGCFLAFCFKFTFFRDTAKRTPLEHLEVVATLTRKEATA